MGGADVPVRRSSHSRSFRSRSSHSRSSRSRSFRSRAKTASTRRSNEIRSRRILLPSYPPSHRRLFSRRAVTISVCRARENRVGFALAVVFAPRSNHFVRASYDQIRTQQRTSLFRQTAFCSADSAQKQRSFKIVPSVVIRNIHIKFHNAHFLFPAPSCPNRVFFSLKKRRPPPSIRKRPPFSVQMPYCSQSAR